MKKIIEFLTANPNGFFATVWEGEPRVRPWQFMFEKDEKLWFCTGNFKEVYKQLKINPKIEFASTSKNFVTVRVRGDVRFSNDFEIKEKIIDNNPLVRSLYKTPDNPTFEVFHLDHGKAIMSDFWSLDVPMLWTKTIDPTWIVGSIERLGTINAWRYLLVGRIGESIIKPVKIMHTKSIHSKNVITIFNPFL